ncbi:hypothetical protein MRY82_10525 [bacterium]|nr:hypothetical protein [bacterium]
MFIKRVLAMLALASILGVNPVLSQKLDCASLYQSPQDVCRCFLNQQGFIDDVEVASLYHYSILNNINLRVLSKNEQESRKALLRLVSFLHYFPQLKSSYAQNRSIQTVRTSDERSKRVNSCDMFHDQLTVYVEDLVFLDKIEQKFIDQQIIDPRPIQKPDANILFVVDGSNSPLATNSLDQTHFFWALKSIRDNLKFLPKQSKVNFALTRISVESKYIELNKDKYLYPSYQNIAVFRQWLDERLSEYTTDKQVFLDFFEEYEPWLEQRYEGEKRSFQYWTEEFANTQNPKTKAAKEQAQASLEFIKKEYNGVQEVKANMNSLSIEQIVKACPISIGRAIRKKIFAQTMELDHSDPEDLVHDEGMRNILRSEQFSGQEKKPDWLVFLSDGGITNVLLESSLNNIDLEKKQVKASEVKIQLKPLKSEQYQQEYFDQLFSTTWVQVLAPVE